MNSWIFWAVIGALMAVGGAAALVNPFPATLAAEQVAAWIFVFSGVLQGVALFRAMSAMDRIWQGVLALACLWLGVSLLTNPLAGIVALTAVVAFGFAVSGVAKLLLATRVRGTPLFLPFLVSGLVSVAFAALVLFNLPQMAGIVLGVMLGMELLLSGVTMIAFAVHARNAPTTPL